MNVYFPTWVRAMVGTVCGVALAAGLAILARADEWNKLTVLTVDQPIQVSDRLLDPGKYVFKLLDSASDRHIVQIFNADQTQLIDTVEAIPNYRLVPADTSRFAFWETPTGDARALRAWFYPGDNVGQEFPYPKHLTALETTTAETNTAARAAEPESAAPPATEPPAVEPLPQAPETTAEQPAPQPEPQPEVAQNNPPEPPPAEPAPPPQPDSQAQTPAELPHTASPYPLIGLAGFAALGLSGLLRRKRSA